MAAKVKERLTFYTFTGTHVNINKNVEETSSHCLNIEETRSHINIKEYSSHYSKMCARCVQDVCKVCSICVQDVCKVCSIGVQGVCICDV